MKKIHYLISLSALIGLFLINSATVNIFAADPPQCSIPAASMANAIQSGANDDIILEQIDRSNDCKAANGKLQTCANYLNSVNFFQNLQNSNVCDETSESKGMLNARLLGRVTTLNSNLCEEQASVIVDEFTNTSKNLGLLNGIYDTCMDSTPGTIPYSEAALDACFDKVDTDDFPGWDADPLTFLQEKEKILKDTQYCTSEDITKENTRIAYALRRVIGAKLFAVTPTPPASVTLTPAPLPQECKTLDQKITRQVAQQLEVCKDYSQYCQSTNLDNPNESEVYGCCNSNDQCKDLVKYYEDLPDDDNILLNPVLSYEDFLSEEKLQKTKDAASCGKLGKSCCIAPYFFDPVVSAATPTSLLGKVNDWMFGSIKGAMNSAMFPVARSVFELRGRSLCSEGASATFFASGQFIGGNKTNLDPIIASIEKSWDENTMEGWEKNWIKYEKDNEISCACTDPKREITTIFQTGQDAESLYTLAEIVPDEAAQHIVRYPVGRDEFSNTNAGIPLEDVLKKSCAKSPNSDECKKCYNQKLDFISGPDNQACLSPKTADRCDAIRKSGEDYQEEYEQCLACSAFDGGGTWTAVGCFYNDLGKTISEKIFGWALGMAGGVALLCIIYASIVMQISAGNPEKVKHAQEMITSCITGLIVVIFSVVILRIIGVDILRIPGFS